MHYCRSIRCADPDRVRRRNIAHNASVTNTDADLKTELPSWLRSITKIRTVHCDNSIDTINTCVDVRAEKCSGTTVRRWIKAQAKAWYFSVGERTCVRNARYGFVATKGRRGRESSSVSEKRAGA